MIREGGEVEKRVVIHKFISEVKRPIRNFSTVGGLYHIQFPVWLTKNKMVKKAAAVVHKRK
jgi:hypothetical protein